MADLEPKTRIESVDLLRGMIMIIMALDHVREFWSVALFRAEDITQTSAPLFFTRWITHLCAPTFAFLSGISVYLVAKRLIDRRSVSLYLIKRGLFLVVCEVVLMSFLFQFSYNLILLEVIWVLGWSMVIMAALIWLPRWAIGLFALIVIAGHNLLPVIKPITTIDYILAALHNSPVVIVRPGMPAILIIYTILPCVGVVAAGYYLGEWLFLDKRTQASRWLLAGLISIGLFLLLRFNNGYGDPISWSAQPRGALFTVLSFLNVSKYPESLDFLGLTLGVACLFLSLFSFYRPIGAEIIKVYGAVPFFFFIIHIPMILAGSLAWTYISFGTAVNLSFDGKDQWPAQYEPSLWRTYVVWILYLALLYFPCKWYANYKRADHPGWLAYI
ncbi:MAG: heparan-alpha-glucosaminide N-acetyltransferase domain-containing protein [Chryseolinea sp.]